MCALSVERRARVGDGGTIGGCATRFKLLVSGRLRDESLERSWLCIFTRVSVDRRHSAFVSHRVCERTFSDDRGRG